MSLGQRPGFEYMDLDDFEELLLDKPDDEKWELIGGRVVRSMVGARNAHHLIVGNVSVALSNTFRRQKSDCRAYRETFWLKQPFIKLAAFPDVMVICGRFDLDATSVDNPTVLFEVVSPTSHRRDRSEKWAEYRRLVGLQHYVMIERDTIHVDVWDRLGDQWSGRQPLDRLDQVLTLPAIGFEMPLSEVYFDVFEA